MLQANWQTKIYPSFYYSYKFAILIKKRIRNRQAMQVSSDGWEFNPALIT